MEGLSDLFVIDGAWQTFLWGFSGSLADEIVSLHRQYILEARIPTRYRRFSYLIIRFFLAVVGGGLAVAYGIDDNPLLAASVGAATPVIIKALSKRTRQLA